MNFDMAAFYTNFIRDIRDRQTAEGAIPETCSIQTVASRATSSLRRLSAAVLVRIEQCGDRRIWVPGTESMSIFCAASPSSNIVRYHFQWDWALNLHAGDYRVTRGITTMSSSSRNQRVLGSSTDATACSQLAVEIKDAERVF